MRHVALHLGLSRASFARLAISLKYIFLGIVSGSIKYALADMDLMFKLLDNKPEIQDAPNAKPLSSVGEGGLCFDKVNFHYQADRPILHEASFKVPAGRKIAIVGASGAGKSYIRLWRKGDRVFDGA